MYFHALYGLEHDPQQIIATLLLAILIVPENDNIDKLENDLYERLEGE
jgi:hypothetical protein